MVAAHIHTQKLGGGYPRVGIAERSFLGPKEQLVEECRGVNYEHNGESLGIKQYHTMEEGRKYGDVLLV